MNTDNQPPHQHKFSYIYVFKEAYCSFKTPKKYCICKICDCGYKLYYKQAKENNYRVSLLPSVDKALDEQTIDECLRLICRPPDNPLKDSDWIVYAGEEMTIGELRKRYAEGTLNQFI